MAVKSTTKDQFLVTTHVKGLKELGEMLKSFTDPKFRKLALNEAGRKTMQPMLAKVKTAAPYLDGEMAKRNPNTKRGILKNSIKFRSKYSDTVQFSKRGKYVKLSQYEYVAQIRTGSESEKFAKALEYGTPAHIVTRDVVFGKNVYPYDVTVPSIAPKAFMRKTLDANYYKLILKFKKELRLSINKKKKAELRKLNKAKRQLIKNKQSFYK